MTIEQGKLIISIIRQEVIKKQSLSSSNVEIKTKKISLKLNIERNWICESSNILALKYFSLSDKLYVK